MKFELLIDIQTARINRICWFELSKLVIYPANKCSNCWHFDIYEQDKFHAKLS